MCDCYTGQCEGCKRDIVIHVGSFSTGRDNITAWCPNCHDAFLAALLKHDPPDEAVKIFVDEIDRSDQVKGVGPSAKTHPKVIFMVDDPHVIHLN